MLTRDSWPAFWIGIALAVVGYLRFADAPMTEWTYDDWLQAASVALLAASTKLGNSPLQGKPKGQG